jgi:hypothetical protein
MVKVMKPREKEKEEKEKTKKNREPKKSTGRDGVLTNSEQDKHLEIKRKKKSKKKLPGSGTMEFQS